MIYTLSDKLILYLEKNNVLKEDKEIYLYGARLVISTLMGTVLLFLVGIITNHFIEAVLYEIVMSSSRSILGGYHCKSYTKCILTYVGIFVVSLVMAEICSLNTTIIVVISITTLLITLTLCPIQNVNKLISLKKKRIFRIYSLIYIWVYLLIIGYLYSIGSPFLGIMISMLVMINILTVGGKIDYEKNKE